MILEKNNLYKNRERKIPSERHRNRKPKKELQRETFTRKKYKFL